MLNHNRRRRAHYTNCTELAKGGEEGGERERERERTHRNLLLNLCVSLRSSSSFHFAFFCNKTKMMQRVDGMTETGSSKEEEAGEEGKKQTKVKARNL